MVYITGDTHGDILSTNIKAMKKLKKTDVVIICGDFGFIWNDTKQELKTLKKLCKYKCTILFVDGCHENHDALKKFKLVELFENEGYQIVDNIFMLQRGHIYTIENNSFLAIGGGQSEDMSIRIDNNTWSEKELIKQKDINLALINIRDKGGNVDYIISHEAPVKIKEFLDMNNNFCTSSSNFLLQQIHDSCNFKKWYFGHYHIDKVIVNKYISTYNQLNKI
ncbi:MAG: metallophosphoesterase family protein [Oscillospiraceae bacterium]